MVKNLFSILGTRQSSILSGAFVLMLTVFASKFLGLIRDRLLVHQFDTAHASIFFAAFNLPDLMFQLLIFGALSVAFIPVFTDYVHRSGETEAFKFASNILNLSVLFFALICLICFFFVSPLNSLLNPGFSGVQKTQTDSLTQVILLGQLMLVIGSFFVGVAQSFQRFIVPALAPLFYNLGIIFGIAVLAPRFGILGLGFGVILGAFLHVLIQFPLINSLGFKYRFSFDLFDRGVREVFRLMSFRTIGLAAELISDKVGFALATLISFSAPTILTFAQHLQVVPVGLFGATVAQAALPVLSREHSQGERQAFKMTVLTTMHQILFLTLPAIAFLVVLRIPVVRLIFGASQFNWSDTVLTGRTLAFLSIGLTAQSIILLLVRAFYALKDTRTPVLVSILMVVLNIFLSILFIKTLHLDVWSLGISYSFSNGVALLLLLYFLDQKVGGFVPRDVFIPASKMIFAAFVSAIALYIPIKALDQVIFDTTRTFNLIILTGITSFIGLSIYILLVWLLKVKELYIFGGMFRKLSKLQFKLGSKEIIKETTPL